jgi:hypothetical protein
MSVEAQPRERLRHRDLASEAMTARILAAGEIADEPGFIRGGHRQRVEPGLDDHAARATNAPTFADGREGYLRALTCGEHAFARQACDRDAIQEKLKHGRQSLIVVLINHGRICRNTAGPE